jgi:hypothetical protein
LSSGNVVVNLLGLQPGVLVQITETTDANGTITITLPAASVSGQQHASGVVTEVHGESFEVEGSDASELRFHMGHDALSNLNLVSCQTVDVT